MVELVLERVRWQREGLRPQRRSAWSNHPRLMRRHRLIVGMEELRRRRRHRHQRGVHLEVRAAVVVEEEDVDLRLPESWVSGRAQLR